MRRITICLAAAAALALPASAAGALKTYGGDINLGGKIGIKADLQGGDPFQVTEMAFKNFPANCSLTGPGTLNAGFDFQNFFVEDKKFKFDEDFTAPNGEGHLFFKGEFRNRARKIEGAIKETFDFNNGNSCTTPKRGYLAKRGGNYPNLKAKVAKAVRIP